MPKHRIPVEARGHRRTQVSRAIERSISAAVALMARKSSASSSAVTTQVATKQEATHDGAPPVDLIDGDQLCDLLKQYELGVRCTVRQTEDVAIDTEFFDEL